MIDKAINMSYNTNKSSTKLISDNRIVEVKKTIDKIKKQFINCFLCSYRVFSLFMIKYMCKI